MIAQPHSRWQKVKKPLEVAAVFVGCLLIIALLVVITLAYIFNVNVPGLSGKNLWDWLDLLSKLAIPLVVLGATIWFGWRQGQLADMQHQIDRQAAEKRAQIDRDIAQGNQQETTLQIYLDRMSELLLVNDLLKSTADKEVRNIARTRTKVVLTRLDPKRKGTVLKFLYESGLIAKDQPIVDISRAELNGAKLHQFILSGANLSGADLSGADLSSASLNGADLSIANLHKADLSGETDLSGANLCGANLHGANLHGANLRDAKLIGDATNLSDADLSEAKLHGAELYEANLSGANLHKADLSEAKLGLVVLSNADLSNAIITQEQLAQAKSLHGAIMADGKRHS